MTNKPEPTQSELREQKEPPLSQKVSSDDSSLVYQKLKSIPTKHKLGTLGGYLADSEIEAIIHLIKSHTQQALAAQQAEHERELNDLAIYVNEMVELKHKDATTDIIFSSAEFWAYKDIQDRLNNLLTKTKGEDK
jgi:hypothetical protein